MDVEVEKEAPTKIEIGDRARICLVASNHDKMQRMSRGITEYSYTGIAKTKLEVGERFELDVGFNLITTSPVQYVGRGIFNTVNSTYSVEKLPARQSSKAWERVKTFLTEGSYA